MHGTVRPWITAGVALTGASLIAATPLTPSLLNVQHRSIQLVDLSDALDTIAGVGPYPEEDLATLMENTAANWYGLEEMQSAITNLWDLPMSVWNAALPQIQTDSATNFHELITQGYVTDSFGDPVLNPVSEASLIVQLLTSLPLAFNASLAGLDAVIQNTTPYWPELPTQFQTGVDDFGNVVSPELLTDYNNALDQIGTVIPTSLGDDYAQAISELGTIGGSLGDDFNNAFSTIGDMGTQFLNLLGGFITGQSISTEWAAIQADAANIIPQSELDTLSSEFNNIVPTSELDTLVTELGNIVPTSELTSLWNDTANIVTTDMPAAVSLWDYISLGPTTIANDFLNGYPVMASSTDPILSSDSGVTVGDAYTLNAPFTGATNYVIAPEFGLLTNPDAPTTVDSGADGSSTTYLGTTPLDTGTLAGALQVENTLDDELTTVAAGVPGSGVTDPPTVTLTPIEGPGNFNLEFYLENLLDKIFVQDPGTNPGFDTEIIPAFGFDIPKLSFDIPKLDIHIPGFDIAKVGIPSFDLSIFNKTDVTIFNKFGFDLQKISFGFHIFSTPCADSACLDLHVPTQAGATVGLGTIDGQSGVPGYTNDLSQNDLAILSSIGAVTAPPSGSVDTTEIGNFLGADPVMNLTGLFDTFIQNLLGSTLGINIDLPLNWANMIGITLNDIFTNVTGFGGLGTGILGTTLNSLVNDFSTLGNDIVDEFTTGFHDVETGFDDLSKYINEIPGLITGEADQVWSDIEGLGSTIESKFESFGSSIEHYWQDVTQGIEHYWHTVTAGLHHTISSVEHLYHDATALYNEVKSELAHVSSLYNSALSEIRHLSNLYNSAESAYNAAEHYISHLLDEIGHAGGIL